MLHYLNSKVPGVSVPKWLIDKIEGFNDEDVEKFGIDFTAKLILNIMEKKNLPWNSSNGIFKGGRSEKFAKLH